MGPRFKVIRKTREAQDQTHGPWFYNASSFTTIPQRLFLLVRQVCHMVQLLTLLVLITFQNLSTYMGLRLNKDAFWKPPERQRHQTVWVSK